MSCQHKIHTVSTTIFIDDLGPLRSVQAIFVWKSRFDAACVLKYENEFVLHENEPVAYFHMSGFARRLVFIIQRQKATRKWPVQVYSVLSKQFSDCTYPKFRSYLI